MDTLTEVENAIKLMEKVVELGITYVRVGDIVIKSRGVSTTPTQLPDELTKEPLAETEEDLLYYSS